jgi:hypothetical protein
MIYELRTYDIRPGTLPEVEQRFADAIEVREKYSPLVGFWHTELGPLNQVLHMWAYEDLNERARIRAEAAKEEKWPPRVTEFCIRQESKILVPSSFSRIQ